MDKNCVVTFRVLIKGSAGANLLLDRIQHAATFCPEIDIIDSAWRLEMTDYQEELPLLPDEDEDEDEQAGEDEEDEQLEMELEA